MTLKGAVHDFLYNLPIAPRTVSNSYTHVARVKSRVQITCNTSDTYHLQQALCHAVWKDSSTNKLDRAEIALILALFHRLKPLAD